MKTFLAIVIASFTTIAFAAESYSPKLIDVHFGDRDFRAIYFISSQVASPLVVCSFEEAKSISLISSGGETPVYLRYRGADYCFCQPSVVLCSNGVLVVVSPRWEIEDRSNKVLVIKTVEVLLRKYKFWLQGASGKDLDGGG